MLELIFHRSYLSAASVVTYSQPPTVRSLHPSPLHSRETFKRAVALSVPADCSSPVIPVLPHSPVFTPHITYTTHLIHHLRTQALLVEWGRGEERAGMAGGGITVFRLGSGGGGIESGQVHASGVSALSIKQAA